MMNSNAQGTLARLLSKENITIQHGNFQTAFFDVESRTLGLPIWKDKGKDVYDLLVGHEVGHALFTPRDFHKDLRGARQDYVNLIEDVRIERMIQSQYPGLMACFARGYSVLAAEDFFGIAKTGVDSRNFPDRLNVKFKLRNLIDVHFTEAELKIKAQIEAAQTWDEVVQAALDLEKFVKDSQGKQNAPKIPQPQQQEQAEDQQESSESTQQNDQSSSESSQDSDEMSAEDDSKDSAAEGKDESAQKTSSEQDGQKSSDGTDESPNKSENAETEQKTAASGTEKPKDFAEPNQSLDVSTQRNFDENAEKLLDHSKETLRTVFASAPTYSESMENIMPYAELKARRMKNSDFTVEFNSQESREAFTQFLKANQKVIGMMVKEFELRKSAHQYSRATTSKTGSLDIDRLHAYRTSDDVFLSVTKLANAKNHGMVMFVDYSGSMNRQLPSVLKHLINMALFCRQAAIPFKVYGFTNDNSLRKKSVDYATLISSTTDKILVSNTILFDLVNSDLSKTDFNDAIYSLWLRSRYDGCRAHVETLGSTPLNETLIIAHDIIKEFRAKHNFDKVTAIFLTDGAGNPLRAGLSVYLDKNRVIDASGWGSYKGDICTKIHGRVVKADVTNMTEKLIENLKVTTCCDTMGFFIPSSSRSVGTHITSGLRQTKKNWQAVLPTYEKSYRADGFVSLPGAMNYDSYFIVASGKDLDIEDEELEITPDMTRSKIAREFKNFSSSKKANRIFVAKFSEAIA